MSRSDLAGPLEFPKGWPGGLHSPDEAALLTRLASETPAGQAIVEIGSWTGVSAIHLAVGAMQGARPNVVCVDPWPQGGHPEWWPEPELADGPFPQFLQRMAAFDWPVVALRGASVDVAQLWIQPVGLLWIDADHHREFVVADYEAWSPHVAPGGWLVMHDYLGDTLEPDTDVAAVVEEVVKPSGLWQDHGLVDKLWYGRRR